MWSWGRSVPNLRPLNASNTSTEQRDMNLAAVNSARDFLRSQQQKQLNILKIKRWILAADFRALGLLFLWQVFSQTDAAKSLYWLAHTTGPRRDAIWLVRQVPTCPLCLCQLSLGCHCLSCSVLVFFPENPKDLTWLLVLPVWYALSHNRAATSSGGMLR